MSVVVIIEPSALERDALERKLRREGYQTVSTQNGRDAIALLPEAIADVVLLDASAPWLNAADSSSHPASGLDTLEQLRHDPRWRSLPVVMLGDSADPSDLLRAEQLKASDFLLKPGLTWSELLSRVRYYAGHRKASAETTRPPGDAVSSDRFGRRNSPDDLDEDFKGRGAN